MSVKYWRVFRLAVVGAAVAISAPLLIQSTPAGAAGPGNTRVRVTAGVNVQKVHGRKPTGPTTRYTELALSFVLKPQNSSQLYSDAQGGVGNDFLSVQQFANEYGAKQSYVQELEQYLSRYGISDFTLYANGLDLKAVGDTTQVDRALGIEEENYQVPAVSRRHGRHGLPAQNVYAPQGRTTMPENLAATIEAILGLTNYAPWTTQLAHATTEPNGKSTTSCVKLSGSATDCNTPADFAADYGLTGLYKQGAEGQGQTLGIVTLAALDRTAPTRFWHTVLRITTARNRVTVDTVDGGPGAPSTTAGTGETDLDTEQSGALAPDAGIVVYQAPNTTAGFLDGFMTAASQNVAGSVSSSWGESEALLDAFGAAGLISPGYQTAFDEAFAEMALQGQSVFIASGDSGAYTDNETTGGEWLTLGVGSPADSPYVTAAGGTTLPISTKVTLTLGTGDQTNVVKVTLKVSTQRAWGWDYLAKAIAKADKTEPFATAAKISVIGSSGGYSTSEPMPSYQQGVPGTQSFSDVQYFTPTATSTDGTTTIGAYFGLSGYQVVTTYSVNAKPPVSTGSGSGRAVPDLAANADPFSGYLLYNPSANTGQALQGSWGGTSFVAPQLNGSDAVIESALGHRVGFWNPSIYSFATGSASPFSPLDQRGTTNDNWYYTGTPGTAYDPATGLGTPNLTGLASDFASEAKSGR